METEINKRKPNLKTGAKILLILLSLYVVVQLVGAYQIRHQLLSPVVPESFIWQITKQFIFHALVAAIGNIIGLILYFFEKYLLVVIWIVLVLGWNIYATSGF